MNTKNSFFDHRHHPPILRILSTFVALSFLFSQAVPYGYADITLRPDESVVSYVPETPADQEQQNTQSSSDIPQDGTTSFYQPSALTATQDASLDQQANVQTEYDGTEYSFDDAVAQLSPDYASAVVVQTLTAENLRQLNSLDIEVGIAVIRGKIVMFTTGSSEDLRTNTVAQSILDESPIFIHSHPQSTLSMPSALDMEIAGATTEYLLSGDGVYAYNSDGILSSALTEEDLVGLLEVNHVPDASSTEAREVLNEFIAAIDDYNSDPTEYTVYRSAQPNSVLPGSPTLGAWNSSGAPTPVVTQQSSSEFSVAYNVTSSGSYVGATINLATNGNSSQDLSSLGYFSFDINSTTACTTSGNNRCVKIEFKDTSNRTVAFGLQNLYTS
jgi:hypothetical protein